MLSILKNIQSFAIYIYLHFSLFYDTHVFTPKKTKRCKYIINYENTKKINILKLNLKRDKYNFSQKKKKIVKDLKNFLKIY